MNFQTWAEMPAISLVLHPWKCQVKQRTLICEKCVWQQQIPWRQRKGYHGGLWGIVMGTITGWLCFLRVSPLSQWKHPVPRSVFFASFLTTALQMLWKINNLTSKLFSQGHSVKRCLLWRKLSVKWLRLFASRQNRSHRFISFFLFPKSLLWIQYVVCDQ